MKNDMHRPLLALVLLAAAASASAAVVATDPAPDAGDTSGNSWLDNLLSGLPDMTTGTPRAERNNNPGNIRLSGTRWQGQVDGSDTQFVTFATPADGFRALAKLLRNYQILYGLRTVRQIINRYAPASENNTAAYISAVAGGLGVGADDSLDLTNNATLAALARAIATHESGRYAWNDADLYAGVATV